MPIVNIERVGAFVQADPPSSFRVAFNGDIGFTDNRIELPVTVSWSDQADLYKCTNPPHNIQMRAYVTGEGIALLIVLDIDGNITWQWVRDLDAVAAGPLAQVPKYNWIRSS